MLLLALVAGAAAAGAALAAAPTGTVVVDQLWCAAFAGGLAWAGARARREIVLVVAAVVAALAATGLSLGLGLAAVGAAAVHALLPRTLRWVNGAAAGLVGLALLTGNGPGPRGQDVLTTTLLAGVLVASGLRNAPRHQRQIALRVLGGVGLVVVLATLSVALAYLVARPDADRGVDAFRAARDAGRAGELDIARSQFEAADRALGDARSSLGLLGLPGRALPGVAQQLRAADEAMAAARAAAETAGTVTGEIRLDRLQVRGGALDLDAIAEAGGPVAELVSVLDRTATRLEHIDRALLAGPVSSILDDARDETLEAGRDAERLQRAIAVAPDLLGASGPRRYLVLLTTPVEARNRFGFPGTYAVMRLDGGRLTFDGAGPISELVPAAPFDQSVLALPARAQPYQPYGVSREWRSVTTPAHFPAAAGTIVQLAEQSPLGAIDGVLVAGPRTAAAVVGLVGDVELADVGEHGITLTEDTTVDFVTRRQYLEFPEPGDQTERKDLLADLATIVGERLETIDLPGLGDLFATFSPLVRADQLAVSIPPSVSPEAAALLAESSLDGAMPAPAVDLLHVGHLNASGSKIDLFLRRALTYDVTVQRDGTVTAELTVELENRAPPSGRPRYLIGSAAALDLPPGTNRTTVLVYSPHQLTEIALDGSPLAPTVVSDGGLLVHQVQVDLGPRQTRTLTARLTGTVPAAPEPGQAYQLLLLPNGLVAPDQTRVVLTDERSGVTGERRVEVHQPTRVTTYRGDVVTLR